MNVACQQGAVHMLSALKAENFHRGPAKKQQFCTAVGGCCSNAVSQSSTRGMWHAPRLIQQHAADALAHVGSVSGAFAVAPMMHRMRTLKTARFAGDRNGTGAKCRVSPVPGLCMSVIQNAICTVPAAWRGQNVDTTSLRVPRGSLNPVLMEPIHV